MLGKALSVETEFWLNRLEPYKMLDCIMTGKTGECSVLDCFLRGPSEQCVFWANLPVVSGQDPFPDSQPGTSGHTSKC